MVANSVQNVIVRHIYTYSYPWSCLLYIVTNHCPNLYFSVANCLEYEDPAVVVKRLQGLNLNLLKKSAWNLIRAALLKQKVQ